MPTQTYSMEPIAVPILKASAISGMSRSAIYRELGAGNLRAVKQGARTLVLVDPIKGYLAGLPEARFRMTSGFKSRNDDRSRHERTG